MQEQPANYERNRTDAVMPEWDQKLREVNRHERRRMVAEYGPKPKRMKVKRKRGPNA